MKSLHLHLRIVWILPSDERNKLSGNINSKLVLVALMAAGTCFPWIPEFINVMSLLTFSITMRGQGKGSVGGWNCVKSFRPRSRAKLMLE